MTSTATEKKQVQAQGSVYCPMCTHTVQAAVTYAARSAHVTVGQRCPRCSASLDAAYVFSGRKAA